MSMRLQVIVAEAELAEFRALAASEGMTLSEWVRQAMRSARRQRSSGDVERRLRAIHAAAEHGFPTADIDDLLADVERGYRRP